MSLEPPVSTPAPPTPTADATNRAWRTLLQGLLFDLAVVVLPALYDAVTGWDGAGGRTYWTAVGLSLAKTAVVAAIAYVMRLVHTPPGNRPATGQA